MTEERAFILDGIFYKVPRLTILQGAYLKVRPGRICGLFGRNGSGKTTLLSVGAGQIQAASGLTIIDDARFHSRSRPKRFAKLAYLPQESMLPPDMRVDRLLRAAGQMELMEDPLLAKLTANQAGELSGGERRYLEVALVLGLRRDYVLLDEPFTGVEPRIINRLSEKIAAAAGEGSGILLTDHYHHYVLPIADEAYVMWQKQCYPLRPDERIDTQLRQMGYLRSS